VGLLAVGEINLLHFVANCQILRPEFRWDLLQHLLRNRRSRFQIVGGLRIKRLFYGRDFIFVRALFDACINATHERAGRLGSVAGGVYRTRNTVSGVQTRSLGLLYSVGLVSCLAALLLLLGLRTNVGTETVARKLIFIGSNDRISLLARNGL
jgi:hypothetical protein